MDGTNQSPIFSGYNPYDNDPILQAATASMSPGAKEKFSFHGRWACHPDVLKLGRLANENPPTLYTHDANGDRLDEVEFHPSWHALMRKAAETGLHNSSWTGEADENGNRHLARAARFFMTYGLEAGHTCPITMTNASIGALQQSDELFASMKDKLFSPNYDFSERPIAQKTGITIGMGMTERQGGSDVRANTSRAHKSNEGHWVINGEKWFMSAPACDGFLVLSQMEEGLGCFFLPRYLDDGSKNGIEFQRLKNKLGNHSNASSEVVFNSAVGTLVGDPGRGIQTIMAMVSMTRLDCAVGSAGLMRVALSEAVHHCRHRSTFGNKLIDQPIMQRVLADVSLDVAGATALSLRLAASFDRETANPSEAAFARLMTPVTKYWVCKTAPMVVNEAMETLGGNGYIETRNMARFYREAPLNAIWEGAGNVMCLDVLRVLHKEPDTLELVLETLKQDLAHENAEAIIEVIRSAANICKEEPGSARLLVEQLAFTAAAAELCRLGQGEVAQAFMDTRLGGLWRNSYGMLDNRHDARVLVDKLYPAAA